MENYNLTLKQLEDFMVTVWEGGSDYWMDLSGSELRRIKKVWNEELSPSPEANDSTSIAEKIAGYLWAGHSVQIVDAEDPEEILGDLTLAKINLAFNRPEMADQAASFMEEQYDVETTDVLIQYAIFNEIVYS
jgi:hypothetical protein